MKMTRCQKLARVQYLIGQARSLHDNDRDQHGFQKGQECLAEAFDLVVELRARCPANDQGATDGR